MKKRIYLILIGLILGIVAFINFENLNITYVILVFLLIAIFSFRKRRDFSFFVIAIALGFFLAFCRLNSYNLTESKGEEILIRISEKKKSKNGYRYSLDIKNEKYKQKAFFFSEDNFEIGTIAKLNADIRLINRNTNPNLFNFRNYALSKNVVSEIRTNSLKSEETLLRSRNILLAIRRNFQKYIENLFSKNLSKKSSDFIISVVLADNFIDKEDINSLGLAHILAVSGLHIDLLISLCVWFFRKLGISIKTSSIISLSLALIYAYIIGFAFSIQRVLIINTISFLAFLLRKPIDRVKSLAIAAIIILLINPFAILNSGFVLSFIASFSIYKVYPRLKDLFKQGFVRDNLAFTSSIQIASLPFSIYYFRYFNILSILANFLLVPIFEIAINIAFLLIFIYPLLKFILRPLFLLLDILSVSILNISEFLAGFSYLRLDFVAENFIISLYLFVLILVFSNIKSKDKVKSFIGLSLIIASFSFVINNKDDYIDYQMIDIGQGDAFLINDRNKYYMIDVGGPKYNNYDSGKSILIPYLKSIGVKEIEAVFITHEDKDHVGNLAQLTREIKVKNIISDNKVSKDFLSYNPKFMKIGDQIKLSNGTITCVFDGAKYSDEKNDYSLGLLINIGGVKILSLGDLSSKYEDKLDIRADILKLSHHGSKTSSSKKFIDKVGASVVLISAGRNNTYGHPNSEVLDNIKTMIKYNTQTDGLVNIRFDGKKVRIDKYLKGGFFR